MDRTYIFGQNILEWTAHGSGAYNVPVR